VRLLENVVERAATLAASYMAAGFVHGVLNTDNINVTGESFDYGPWRFTPTWDPGFVAAYFDHAGLYAFGRQPEAIHWNVMQLAVSLRTLVDAEPLIAALERFPALYQRAVTAKLLWRLGVNPRDEAEDSATIQAIEPALRSTNAPIDGFFHDAFGGIIPDHYGADFDAARAALAPYTPRKDRYDSYWSGPPTAMLIDEVEAIWAAIDEGDDWAPFHAKIAQVRRFGQALA